MSKQEMYIASGIALFIIGIFTNPIFCVAGALLLVANEAGQSR